MQVTCFITTPKTKHKRKLLSLVLLSPPEEGWKESKFWVITSQSSNSILGRTNNFEAGRVGSETESILGPLFLIHSYFFFHIGKQSKLSSRAYII